MSSPVVLTASIGFTAWCVNGQQGEIHPAADRQYPRARRVYRWHDFLPDDYERISGYLHEIIGRVFYRLIS